MFERSLKAGRKSCWAKPALMGYKAWPLVISVLVALFCSGVLTSQGKASEGQSFCSKPTLPVGEAPPPFKVRLGIQRTTVGAGATLRVRVENLGATSATYGYAYRLARFNQGHWINQPTGPVFGAKLFAQPEHAGSCQAISISAHVATGKYRISKPISSVGPEKRAVVAHATFRIH